MIPEGQAIPYVDEDGNLLGMWLGSVPDYGFPVDVLPDDGRQKWNGTSWFYPKSVARQIAMDRLSNDFIQSMSRLQNGWEILEMLTWYKQDKESEAWLNAPADAKPETPFLTSLFYKCAALGSSDTFEAMITRIRANDARYTEAVTSIMAVKHFAEDEIDASDDPMSITWQFP